MEPNSDLTAAMARARCAAQADPTNPKHLFYLGYLQHEAGDLEGAIASLTAAAEHGAPAFAHSLLADCYETFGRLAEAAEAYREAIRIEPQAHRYVLLGHVLNHLGLLEDAIEALRAALRLEPDYDEAHYNMGCYLSSQDPVSAEEHFRHAIRVDPHYGIAYRELGTLLLQQQRPEEGMAALRRAIEINPKDLWACLWLATACGGTGDLAEAERLCQQAVACEPTLSFAHCKLGDVHLQRPNLDAAKSSYLQAHELEPSDSAPMLRLAEVCRQQGQDQQAREWLQQILAHDPDHAEARQQLAELDS